MDYSELPGLSTYYLEDSYVLGINSEPGKLIFRLEVVLTEDHPRYQAPGPDEQYCYANGSLIFSDVVSHDWVSENLRTFTDAAGEEDMGNIDFLKKEDDRWRVGGEWGEVLIRSGTPPVITLDS